MRWLLALLSLIVAAPATAQTYASPAWNPAAPYVTAGQDEPGYRAWVAASRWRPVYVKAFNNYLVTYGVGGVVPTSTHLHMGAVDMVPLRPISREALMSQLCAIHYESGPANATGLGFYKGLRFHIDTRKYREWGTMGARGGYGCASVLAEGAAPFQA